MVQEVKKPAFFQRILPRPLTERLLIYNITVILLSAIISSAGFIIFLFLVIPAAYIVSEKLHAGIAGMSITLLFITLALFAAILLFIFLLLTNLRKKPLKSVNYN